MKISILKTRINHMELKSTYNTFEIETAIHKLNEVLKFQQKAITVAIHRHPEDGSHSIKCTQEFIDDVFELANTRCLKKEKFMLIEYDTLAGLAVLLTEPQCTLSTVDRLRSEGHSPRISKIVECYPTIQDMLDQEILHKMRKAAEKENANKVSNILLRK